MNIVIICAAGPGKRLGHKLPKALVPVLKKPIFIHALNLFSTSLIDKVVVVVPKTHLNKFKKAAQKFLSKKIKGKILEFVEGGRERQDSIKKGLDYLIAQKTDPGTLILVHNAANIFLEETDIKKLLTEIKRGNASAVALPSTDTLRELTAKMKPVKKLDRSQIWRMQTPQGAPLKIMLKAYEKAVWDKYIGTDDLELIERIGYPVRIIEGSKLNFKITYPEDLKLAEALMEKRL